MPFLLLIGTPRRLRGRRGNPIKHTVVLHASLLQSTRNPSVTKQGTCGDSSRMDEGSA
jgi:hypothetical protein